MSKFTVTVKNRSSKGTTTGVEGIYQLPNSTPAKLARKDGTTVFPNCGSLTQAAMRLATAIGWQVEMNDPQKKAAKKSVKKTPAKATAKTAKTSKPTTPCSKDATCSKKA
jgi:hypothetical protein